MYRKLKYIYQGYLSRTPPKNEAP